MLPIGDWNDEREWAWAAGFFEGEGTIYVPPAGQGRLRLSLTQAAGADGAPPAALLRFQRIVGCGDVEPREPNHLSVRPLWVWRLQRSDDAERVLERLAVYLTDGTKHRGPVTSARSV